MSFLLDTSVISELVKKSPHGPVLKWIDDQDETLLYLSVITIGELEKGIARLSASARRNRRAERGEAYAASRSTV